MILPLRQRHRHIFITLAVFLPVAFVAGMVLRKATPVVSALTLDSRDTSRHFDAVEWERAGLFAKSPVTMKLRREQKDKGEFAVQFEAPADFLKPDLIVYWVAGNPKAIEKLPDDALLLGAFAPGVEMPLPGGTLPAGGMVVLFSLVDQEIVDVSKPVSLQTQ